MIYLSIDLFLSNIGCRMYIVLMNHIFYAAVLLAISPAPFRALQMLIDIRVKYADEFDLQFNVKKTKSFENCNFHDFYLDDTT